MCAPAPKPTPYGRTAVRPYAAQALRDLAMRIELGGVGTEDLLVFVDCLRVDDDEVAGAHLDSGAEHVILQRLAERERRRMKPHRLERHGLQELQVAHVLPVVGMILEPGQQMLKAGCHPHRGRIGGRNDEHHRLLQDEFVLEVGHIDCESHQ
jgi:hypothetical protein